MGNCKERTTDCPNIAENYSIYGVEIVLTRVLSPYILSVYLPSAMFVSMSWVTFNIHVYAQGE